MVKIHNKDKHILESSLRGNKEFIKELSPWHSRLWIWHCICNGSSHSEVQVWFLAQSSGTAPAVAQVEAAAQIWFPAWERPYEVQPKWGVGGVSISGYFLPISLCSALYNCYYWAEKEGGKMERQMRFLEVFLTWTIYSRGFSCCHKDDLSSYPPTNYLSSLIPCYSPPFLSTAALHLIVVARTYQAHFQLWPFVLSVPSALNALL